MKRPWPLLRARAAVALIFFLNGALFASWVPRIPEMRDRLGVGEGALGLALLALGCGALLAMMATGRAIDRIGARRPLAASTLLFGLSFTLIGAAHSLPALAAALFVFGAAAGALDVSMNVEGAAVERGWGRPILSSFHGLFSLGGLLGAPVAGLLAEDGLGLAPHFLVAGLLAAALGGLAARALPPLPPALEATSPPNRRGVVLLFGAMAFAALLAEGAVADWSALLLRDWKGAGPAEAGFAFAAFSGAMAAGRFAGDALIARLGRVAVVGGGGALGAAGLALAALAPEAGAATVGFVLAGLGVSCLFPALIAASIAAAPPAAAGGSVAAVATLGYFGFLAGPPGVGFLAEAAGLPAALLVVAALLLAAAAAAPAAGRPAVAA